MLALLASVVLSFGIPEMPSYDPRTGITSFAQADPSADVNAAIDVPEAIAPSTATALAPRGAKPGSMDELWERYFPGWQTANADQLTYAPGPRPAPGAGYDTYNMQWVGGSTPLDVAYRAASAGNIEDWLYALDLAQQRTEYEDSYNMTGARTTGGFNPYGYLGEDLIRGPLDQIAGAAGVQGVDWEPYLEQYWFDEWNDQLAHGRKPGDIFRHGQGYGDILGGVSDLAGFGDIAAENIGPGTGFYEQYNNLGNWIESQRDSRRDKGFASVAALAAGGLLAPYIAPAVSTAAGGGAMGTIASGAVMGGMQGLFTGDPVGGALRGGLSAGLPVAAGAAGDYLGGADGMLARMGFSGDAAFGGVADAADATKRASTATALYSQPAQTVEPLFGGGSFSQPAMTTMQDPGALLTGGMLPATVATQNLFPGATGSVDTPKPEVDVKEPSLMDKAGRYVKLGQALASLGGGGSAPQDAPQREEGQSDEQYVQRLADYANVNVDAQALAEMGLTPGTPQYYEYLMGQLDSTLSGYEDAADLSAQLRGKTQDELTSLRRALFVRGQLEQLMGSGTYTDPFSGRDTEVIDAGGAGVNPGMAAYQRGLGNTIEGFAGLDPEARREEIGAFLGRDPDLYGAQGRMDARSEQEAMVQQFLEDLKRRQGGMLRGAFWE